MTDSDFQKLQSFFAPVSLDGKQESAFKYLWTVRTFKQYDLITEAGQTEHYFYFVLEGVQAIYVLNEKGQKVVLGFSYAGSPSGVFDSFIRRTPSITFLEALKPSKLLAISFANYEKLFEEYPQFQRWGHEFFKEVLLGRLSREVELLTLDSKQRYIDFMRRCPDELKVIPQKYLASYLNMKPETFSRLRASVIY